MTEKQQNKKRIFVAVAISKSLQRKIFDWKKKHKSARWWTSVRWLVSKNLHITLIPPWYEKNVDNVKNRLARQSFSEGGAFNILFEKVEFGPDLKKPRLIWTTGKTPKEALNLKKSLEKTLKRKSEYRTWKLHLTIARFREEDFDKFPVKKLDEHVEWKEKVRSFVLMESHLSPKGADYKILKKYDF